MSAYTILSQPVNSLAEGFNHVDPSEEYQVNFVSNQRYVHNSVVPLFLYTFSGPHAAEIAASTYALVATWLEAVGVAAVMVPEFI